MFIFIVGEPVVVKHHVNSFVNTNLLEEHKKTGKQELIVIGFMTHMCVTTTVRGNDDDNNSNNNTTSTNHHLLTFLFAAAVEQHGFKCYVVANATATRDLPVTSVSDQVISADQVQKSHLAAMADFFAVVVDDLAQLKIVV